MASRGEVDGRRVEECRRALAWWRLHDSISAEVARGTIPADRATELVEHVTAAMS